jgi:hypothetical protein
VAGSLLRNVSAASAWPVLRHTYGRAILYESLLTERFSMKAALPARYQKLFSCLEIDRRAQRECARHGNDSVPSSQIGHPPMSVGPGLTHWARAYSETA